MNNPSDIDIDPGIPTHAVSIVNDNVEDFPVLKAFQQYIDAEQNKARKRMISLCIFFGCLMTLVIVVFLILLNGISMRNQALNDRMIEYVMKERDRQAAVVVQQPANDHSTVYLTTKIEEMQKKLAEAQQKSEAIENARKEEAAKAAAEAAVKAANEKARIREEIEVARLKAQLAAEREKANAEREKKHQEELEAYRRKHYPELYGKKPVALQQQPAAAKKQPLPDASVSAEEAKVDKEIDTLVEELDDKDAITYFETEEEDVKETSSYSIPVEVKGKQSNWLIPKE